MSDQKSDHAELRGLLLKHPMQYGFRGYHARAEVVYEPRDDASVVERLNRCPTCEEWSPYKERVRILNAIGESS